MIEDKILKKFKKYGNVYQILSISEDANKKDIKKAHKKLARLFHPDKNPGNEDKFIKI